MRLATLAVPEGPLPLWPPLLATRGPGSRSDAHAHHAMHVVLAIEGRLRVRLGDRTIEHAGVLTAPDVPHAIDADGLEILLVFVDPESTVGAALRPDEDVRAIDEDVRDRLVAGADPLRLMTTEGDAWSREVARALGHDVPAARRPVHPRVRRVLSHLRTRDERDDASLEALAELAGLSPSRLMHAFTESVGIPLRPYLAWLKLQRAASGIVSGLPLAHAAQAAGFADTAHMSRSFRRMLGMPPSALRGRVAR